MSAMSERTEQVLNFLRQQDEPVAAKDVQVATKLSLAMVIKVLQSQANEYVPEVRRIQDGERTLYQYIGPSIDDADVDVDTDTDVGADPDVDVDTDTDVDVDTDTDVGADADVGADVELKAKPSAEKPKRDKPAQTVSDDGAEALKIRVAEFLSERPMNITRLAKELNVPQEMLEAPLKELVSDTLVEPKELMDDTVYRASPSIMSKLSVQPASAKKEQQKSARSTKKRAEYENLELVDELMHALSHYTQIRSDLQDAISKIDVEIDSIQKKLKQASS